MFIPEYSDQIPQCCMEKLSITRSTAAVIVRYMMKETITLQSGGSILLSAVLLHRRRTKMSFKRAAEEWNPAPLYERCFKSLHTIPSTRNQLIGTTMTTTCDPFDMEASSSCLKKKNRQNRCPTNFFGPFGIVR